MLNGILRQLPLLLALVTVAGVSIQMPSEPSPRAKLAAAESRRLGELPALRPSCYEDPPAPAPAPGSCAREAAGPAPLGPDGRPANYLHTCGSRIYDSRGREVRIVGLNWAGMETNTFAPEGLHARRWEEILDQVAALGYNTLRIPFTNEGLEPDRKIDGVDFALNPDLQGLTGLEMLDKLIAGARERGLRVVLDRHRPTSAGQSELWYTAAVPEERWIADWRMLAARYYGNDTVIGFDLHNEPHGQATWGTGDPATDWRLAAERAGNAVLEVNPNLLIFVQGVAQHEGEQFWWGGELRGVRSAPVRLQVPNRVVYSPRDYGPSVYEQGWFRDAGFPANLPDLWDRHWGFIHREGVAPIVLGEVGGYTVGDARGARWQEAITAYARRHGVGVLIWSLNPNGDTGGLFSEDWRRVESAKQEGYREVLDIPAGRGEDGWSAAPTGQARVLLRQRSASTWTDEIAFELRVVNDGPSPLDLGSLEVRYWYSAGSVGPGDQLAVVEPSGERSVGATASLVPVAAAGQSHYVSVRFPVGSGSIAPYELGPKVSVRLSRTDGLRYFQPNDHSFAGDRAGVGRLEPLDRLTLHVDGRLVWGREP